MPMQVRRTATPNLPPTGLAEGQLGVEMAGSRPRMWVGVPTAIDPSGRRLLVPSGATSSATAPASPTVGDLWYDPGNDVLNFYDGTNWVPVPMGDPHDGLMYARQDGAWVEVKIPDIPEDAPLVQIGGRLEAVSGSQIIFRPFNGSWIRINGVDIALPANGIVSAATNVVIDGVAGQNLAINTLYYVYLFNQAGTLTMEFSTTGHQTSATAGNVGTEIKQSDDSRTLLGMVYLLTAATFANNLRLRLVRSWLNRGITNFFEEGNAAVAIGTWFNQYYCELLTFSNEIIFSTVTGSWNAPYNVAVIYGVMIDWAAPSTFGASTIFSSGWVSGAIVDTRSFTEGHHVIGLANYVAPAQSVAGSGSIAGFY